MLYNVCQAAKNRLEMTARFQFYERRDGQFLTKQGSKTVKKYV